MAKKIFVNLPVKNLDQSKAFFNNLGFQFNPQFTDENGACMVISEDIFIMLLVEKRFRDFTKKAISDASTTTEVIIALSTESRAEVDELVRQAVAGGGTVPMESQDHGFMYAHGFQDLDGHLWEVIYMDPSAVQGG